MLFLIVFRNIYIVIFECSRGILCMKILFITIPHLPDNSILFICYKICVFYPIGVF